MEDIYELKKIIRINLENEDLITDPNICIIQFAEKINISPKKASEIIKDEFKTRFSKLINKHRIQIAIRKIEDGFLDLYTLEALGEALGFSSRTTFFNTFKKEMGISPSGYWKKYQELPE